MGTWTRCQEYLDILKEITGKEEEELEWFVDVMKGQGFQKEEEMKVMWMRETRIRIFMQMGLKACRDKLDWLSKCYLCAVNSCQEEYCPPMLLPIASDYAKKSVRRPEMAQKGILPPTSKMTLKKYDPLPVHQSPVLSQHHHISCSKSMP